MDNSGIARLLNDGTLDTSYGVNGIVNVGSYVQQMELQPDGKLVLFNGLRESGASTTTLRFSRLNTNGQVDTSFGNQGVVSIVRERMSNFKRMTIARDGSIFVIGHDVGSYDQPFSFVYKLNANGQLDAGFGTGGVANLPVNTEFWPRGLAVQPDGMVLVSGGIVRGFADDATAVIRLRTDGTLDSGFGTAGVARFDLSDIPMETADFLALEPDGKIIVGTDAGVPEEFYTQQQVFLRLHANGTVDDSFARQTTDAKELVDMAVGPGGLFALEYNIFATPTSPATEGTYFVRNFHAGPWPRTGSLSTSGTPSASSFQVDVRGMTDDILTQASLTHPVDVSAYIFPESGAIGSEADVYVVAWTPRGWHMLNAAGTFVRWNRQESTLTPAYENVPLTALTHVPVYAGTLPFHGSYRYYISYSVEDGPLIYSAQPRELSVTR